MPVTRGFSRRRPDSPAGRLPPGQYDVGGGWPVLTAEATPRIQLDSWTLRVDGPWQPTTWTWDTVQQLSRVPRDIHCVTTWSKFDVVFAAVTRACRRPQAEAGSWWPTRPADQPAPVGRGGGRRDRVSEVEDRPGWGSATATTTAGTRGSSSLRGRPSASQPAAARRRGDGMDDGRHTRTDLVRLRMHVEDRNAAGLGLAPGRPRSSLSVRDATHWSSLSRGSRTGRSRSSWPRGRGRRRPRAARPDRGQVHVHPGVPGRRDRRRAAIAMTRAARHLGRPDLLSVVAVGRSPEELPYAEELARAGAAIAYTRHPTSARSAGSPTKEEIVPLLAGAQLAYVCGSSRFAGFAETLLIESGLSPEAIRVERFGVTG